VFLAGCVTAFSYANAYTGGSGFGGGYALNRGEPVPQPTPVCVKEVDDAGFSSIDFNALARQRAVTECLESKYYLWLLSGQPDLNEFLREQQLICWLETAGGGS